MPQDRLVVLGATGATGATGTSVVRLAADVGLLPVAVARRPDALARAFAGQGIETRVATLSAEDLDRVLVDAAVVVSGVGPATAHGAPIVAAALRAGAHYVDFSGEPRWVHRVAEHFGPRAEAAGVALVPSVGLGIAGDLAACRATAEVGAVRRLTVAYRIVGMHPAVATARSTLEILAGGAPLASAAGVRFAPAGRAGAALPGVRFPTPDAVMLHTLWPAAQIESVMTLPVPALTGTVLGGLGAALRRDVILRAARRGLATWADRPREHPRGGGGRATATVIAEGSTGSCTVVASVADVYDLTARAGFLAARALLAGDARSPVATRTS